MVGILTALSAVALVQYGKYKRNAGAEVASAQSQFESENCIGVPNRKQCLCDRGLGEVLGLDSEDCCPLGQEKDSNGNCVARVAQAGSAPTSSQNPPPKDPPETNPTSCENSWQKRESDGTCVNKECDVSPTNSYIHPYLFSFSNNPGGAPALSTPKCLCPDGYVWLIPIDKFGNSIIISHNYDDLPNAMEGAMIICEVYSDSFHTAGTFSSHSQDFGTIYRGYSSKHK